MLEINAVEMLGFVLLYRRNVSKKRFLEVLNKLS